MSTFQYKFTYNPTNPKAGSNGCVYEHVLVAEEMLGRPLTKCETVHHIDRNKKNNSPDNLMIFASMPEHTSFHNGGQAWSNDGLIWHTARKVRYRFCIECGKPFISRHRSAQQKYCSKECARKKDIKHIGPCKPMQPRPNIEEKIKNVQQLLYENNGNFSAVARIYNVSSSGLAKLLKEHGLPHHSKDYRTK